MHKSICILWGSHLVHLYWHQAKINRGVRFFTEYNYTAAIKLMLSLLPPSVYICYCTYISVCSIMIFFFFVRLTNLSFCLVYPLQYSKHLFVHIGQTNPSYSDPLLEAVDIRQIYDKFPEKKGGLKELYEKGPQNAFFLVKFWVGSFIQLIHLVI